MILAADRYGLSFYSYDKICTLLEMSLDQYVEARCALIKKDLIVFTAPFFRYSRYLRLLKIKPPAVAFCDYGFDIPSKKAEDEGETKIRYHLLPKTIPTAPAE